LGVISLILENDFGIIKYENMTQKLFTMETGTI